MNRLIVLISFLITGLGCASPLVTKPKYEKALNSRHWFEQLVHDQPTPLTYLSPRQPYLSNFIPVTSPSRNHLVPKLPAIPTLSPGDRIRSWMPKSSLFAGVFSENDDEFSHVFEINLDGKIKMPYLNPIQAAGLTLPRLEKKVNEALVEQGLYNPGMANLSIAIVEWAPVKVFVSGAVFSPGQVTINLRKAEIRKLLRDNSSGDLPLERMLPTALKSAGGVRPDADISQIEVIRQGKAHHVDLRGVILGYPISSMPLMDGDMIRIPSVGTPQVELITPSAITTPGVRVFISNLTVPALNNASSAVGANSTSLPYGSRLLTAAISGNCAGGTVSVNSGRYVVLITQDPVTQKPIAIEREIETLLRAPNRVDLNPFIMPNDSLVCYDSQISNARDIGRSISDILFPISWIVRGL
jgi:polysaccharide biosynthesis/export protein